MVDWDGLAGRIVAVPLPAGRYCKLDAISGKILVLNQTVNPTIDAPPSEANELISFDLDSRKPTTLISGIDDFQKSFDNKKLLFVAGQSLSVHDASTQPTAMSQGSVDLGPYSITYLPIPEWHEAFEESWRIARDFFYDPNMHGLNWNAIRAKYEARLLLVGDRTDLSRLLADMISELNTGHAYIGYSTPAAHEQNMGFLGVDVESVPGANAVRIKKLCRGDPWSPGLHSPLLDPGINVKEG